MRKPVIHVSSSSNDPKRRAQKMKELNLLCDFAGIDEITYLDQHITEGTETYILRKKNRILKLYVSSDHMDAIASLFVSIPKTTR